MTKTRFPHVIAAVAAVVTTFSLFSTVVSIADSDKAAVVAARSTPVMVAQGSPSVQR